MSWGNGIFNRLGQTVAEDNVIVDGERYKMDGLSVTKIKKEKWTWLIGPISFLIFALMMWGGAQLALHLRCVQTEEGCKWLWLTQEQIKQEWTKDQNN